MPDTRLQLLALFDREDREQAEEEQREWDARIVVAKARLDGKRFVAVAPGIRHRLSVRTPTGWVDLRDGELIPSNVRFSTLAYMLAQKRPCIRVVEVRG